MRFTRVELRNWKSFRQVSVALERRAFLVGPNASGKSNFLDVFRFLRDVTKTGGGFQSAVTDRGGVSALRSLHARGQAEIGIVVDVELGGANWRYEIAFTQSKQREPMLRREAIFSDGRALLERPDAQDNADPARLTQTILEQVVSNKDFRPLAEFFETVRYYHVVPQLVRDGGRSYHSQITNDPFGSDFLEKIATTPDRTRNARLKRIERALRLIAPNFSDLTFERDERGAPHLKAKFKHWRPQGAWQREEQFSDGTLRLMGLLWSLMEGGGPLLLEEPELSLHPSIVRHIPGMFAKVLRQSRTTRQILVSTHSSSMLGDEGVDFSEVLVLRPTDDGVIIEPASTLREIRELVEAGEPLGDAVEPFTRPPAVRQLSLFDLND